MILNKHSFVVPPLPFCLLILSFSFPNFLSLSPFYFSQLYSSLFCYKENTRYFIRNNSRRSIVTSKRWISVYSILPINWHKYKRN